MQYLCTVDDDADEDKVVVVVVAVVSGEVDRRKDADRCDTNEDGDRRSWMTATIVTRYSTK